MRARWLVAVAVLGAFWSAHRDWQHRRLEQAPGVLAPDPPEQRSVAASRHFSRAGFELEALAEYRIRARLLRREPYRFDAGAELSPLDFALGWGVMSDSSVLDRLEIGQSVRYFSWRYEGEPPAPPALIQRSAANTHLIPADDGVAETLDRMRPGQLIELAGYLVEAKGPGGFTWKSSLTREDAGGGACELLWVESARII